MEETLQHRVVKSIPSVFRHFLAWVTTFASVGVIVAAGINTANAVEPGVSVPFNDEGKMEVRRHLPAGAGMEPETFKSNYAGRLIPEVQEIDPYILEWYVRHSNKYADLLRKVARGRDQIAGRGNLGVNMAGYWVRSDLERAAGRPIQVTHQAIIQPQGMADNLVVQRSASTSFDISRVGSDRQIEEDLEEDTMLGSYQPVPGDKDGAQVLMITGRHSVDKCFYIKTALTTSWSSAPVRFQPWIRGPGQPLEPKPCDEPDELVVSAVDNKVSISGVTGIGVSQDEYTVNPEGTLTLSATSRQDTGSQVWEKLSHAVEVTSLPGRLNDIGVLGDDGVFRVVNPKTGSVEELDYGATPLHLSVDKAVQQLSMSPEKINGHYRLAALTKSGEVNLLQVPDAAQTCAYKKRSPGTETCALSVRHFYKPPHDKLQPSPAGVVKSVSYRQDPLNPGKWLLVARTDDGAVWETGADHMGPWYKPLFADPGFPVLSGDAAPKLDADEKPLEWTMVAINKDGTKHALAIRTSKRMFIAPVAPIRSGGLVEWKSLKGQAGWPPTGDGTGMTAFRRDGGRLHFLFNDADGHPHMVAVDPGPAGLCKDNTDPCQFPGDLHMHYNLFTKGELETNSPFIQLAAPMFASRDPNGNLVLDGITRFDRRVQQVFWSGDLDNRSEIYPNYSPDAPPVGGHVVWEYGVRSDQIRRDADGPFSPTSAAVTVWTRLVTLKGTDERQVVEVHRGGSSVFGHHPLPTWAVSVPTTEMPFPGVSTGELTLDGTPTPVIAPDGSVTLFATTKGGIAGDFVVSHVDAKGVASPWTTMHRVEPCSMFGCTNEVTFNQTGGAAIAAGYVGGENGHYTYTVAAKNARGALVAFALQLNRKVDGSIELQQQSGSSAPIPAEEQINFGGAPFLEVTLARDFNNARSFIALITGAKGVYLKRIELDHAGKPKPDSVSTGRWVGPMNPGIWHEQVKELGREPYQFEQKATIDATITPNATFERGFLSFMVVDQKGSAWLAEYNPYQLNNSKWSEHRDVIADSSGSAVGLHIERWDVGQIIATDQNNDSLNYKQLTENHTWGPWHSTIDLKAPPPIF